jgi:hypothetical protein
MHKLMEIDDPMAQGLVPDYPGPRLRRGVSCLAEMHIMATAG